ncbi:MAG: F0F1 ATP synthase subunit gamma, partial [Desulfuromonadales bacterium]|nr:F0F1 ATP synthase subunit gamma [Desulfuromonadales bacterium]NIS41803.1 F0F1 ATP synthase subunit gamma [Desulfuromonadales bacterium]
YADKMLDVLSNLALREESGVHPLLQERGKGKALVVLMTADRGLCGGFNTNISKTAERFVRNNEEGFEAYDILIVGRKGNE